VTTNNAGDVWDYLYLYIRWAADVAFVGAVVWCLQTSGGYEVSRSSETEAAAGDGWDDADDWESFEVTQPQSAAKSRVCFLPQ